MSFFNAYKFLKKKKLNPTHKVYLSISSEGYGHSSRALAIAHQFPKNEILVGTYGYALERFKYAGYPYVELPQELKLIGEQGEFNVQKTIIKNHTWAYTFNSIVKKEIDIIRESRASCVVADGRLAPVMAADKLGLPCVVITNQSAFYPFFEQDTALVRVFGRSFDWVMKTWLSSAEEIMIPDFPPPCTICLPNLSHKYKVMKRTRFVGPLVAFEDNEIIPIDKPGDKYVVATLGGHEYRKPLFDQIIETAKIMPDVYFDVFTSFTATDVPKNVRIKEMVPVIAPYIKAADAVITQAGHSTAMELLTLGKPSVIIPDAKQIEQENNASRMKEMEVALTISYDELFPEKLADSLRKVISEPKYKHNAEKFKEMAKKIQGSKKAAEVLREYSSRLQYY
ncbi:MAG TPA: hypothetical protein DDW90_09725 [Cyanobacteria bacterium UBA9971]|nr:hypothetical protein [Cyanobacteria bacterium UBA9971]